MKTITCTITDELGLHARPAGLLVKKALAYKSESTIKASGRSSNAKRLMSVMALAIKQGTEVTITFEGEDEEEASAAMEQFFKEQNL